jgi:hypothetical protein
LVDWLYKNKTEIIILLVLGAFANLAFYLQFYGFSIAFCDTDDYMRLVRTREFFNSYDLSNTIIARSNVPFGCDLHWTRFYDFFIIVPVYILNFFIGSINKSIEIVCFLISPIIKSVAIVVFFNIARKLMSRKNAFLCSAAFAAHPLIIEFGIFGRPDHHAFIMLFIVLYLNSVIVAAQSKKAYIKPAVIAALCVWISPETLIPIVLIDGVLFIYFFSDEEGLEFLYKKSLATACCVGAIVLVPCRSIEDVRRILTVEYDKISNLHAVLFFYATLYYWGVYKGGKSSPSLYWLFLFFFPFPLSLKSFDPFSLSFITSLILWFSLAGFCIFTRKQKWDLRKRAIFAVVCFFIIALDFLDIYPNFFEGMSGGVDDYVKEIWLSRVSEMQSPFTHGDGAFFITYCVIIATSIAGKVAELILGKKVDFRSLIWSILIVNAVCYTIFAGISYRMLPYSVMFGLPIIIDFGMNGRLTKSLDRIPRIIISTFLSVFFVFCAPLFNPNDQKNKNSAQSYSQSELFAAIDNLSQDPVVIMAHSNDGPALLYYTKHSVVGAPYHRQTQGIIFSYKTMSDEYDEETVKNILKITNSSYIFVRKLKRADETKRSSLARMICDGILPEWISVIKLPEKFNDVVIAKIDREKL